MKHTFTLNIPQHIGQHKYSRFSSLRWKKMINSAEVRETENWQVNEFTLETTFKNRERCYKILSTLSDNNTNCYYQKRMKTLLDQHILCGLISMKNSYFYMMKFKHGCRKNNKFLMKNVFEREMKKLWYLRRVLRSGS